MGNEPFSTGGVCIVMLMATKASAASSIAFGAALGSSLVISAGAFCYRILEGYGFGIGAVGLVCFCIRHFK